MEMRTGHRDAYKWGQVGMMSIEMPGERLRSNQRVLACNKIEID